MKNDGEPEQVQTNFSIRTLRSDDYSFLVHEPLARATEFVVVHNHEHGNMVHAGNDETFIDPLHFPTDKYQYHNILGNLHAHKRRLGGI